ncbi:MAG: extracellular solute-binding protein [Hyphomicrobiales bacterium]|nr:extracellular solute-binding protein [Hyphomicrobiales bacterium]
MVQFLEFIEQLEDETEAALDIRTGGREVRLLLSLVRNHLHGKTTTSSSLAAASGMSYGTALRAIAACQARGLIVKRPRTPTGKSFSLHPSPRLLHRWQDYARRTRSLLAATFDPHQSNRTQSDYFFGASYSEGSVLPLQSALDRKLHLSSDLRVLVHADPTFMAMHTLKKHFQYIFGTGIQIRALSIDRLRQEIIENGNLKLSRYDVVACDLPWFGELASNGALQSLDALMVESGFDGSDFHPAAVASTRHRGAHYGVPVQGSPELLVYRTDLFSEHGMAEPATTQAVLDAARRLHAPMSGRYGIAWNAARGTPLGHSFLMVMGSSFGQPVINLAATSEGFDTEHPHGEQMRPMFLSDAARSTGEYLMELLDYSPPSILSMSWYERAVAYASGSAAMAYCYTLLAPIFELDRHSPGHGNTGYLPHPVGPGGTPIAPVGGYALAMPSNVSPDRVAAAWAAIRSLTAPSAAKLYISNGSVVSPRYSVSSDPDVRSVSPIIPAVDAMARKGYLQIWPRPPVPEISEIIAIVGEEVHDMLRRHKSIDDALAGAQNRVDLLMRANGHY